MSRTRTLEYMVWLAGLSLPVNSMAVAFRLCAAADDRAECWPGVVTLARQTQLSERAVQRALRHLEGKRLIERVMVAGSKNGYRLCVAQRMVAAGARHFRADAGTRKGRLTVTGDCESPVTQMTLGGCPTVAGGVTHSHPEETTLLEETTSTAEEDARARGPSVREIMRGEIRHGRR